jgi:O-acetyl-ADP-ribose deacetylase (regulator of RNase III)
LIEYLSRRWYIFCLCYFIKLEIENMERGFLNGRVNVVVGDITRQTVDAIVNAANSTLLGGGGVDGAIHQAGGEEILEACREIRRAQFLDGLPFGEAVITTAGKLPASFVIHTVGPIYGNHSGNEPTLLADCYRNSLALAAAQDFTTVAFPSISTGAYHYPKHEAAKIASRAIEEFLSHNEKPHEIRLVFFSPSDAETFIKHQVFSS